MKNVELFRRNKKLKTLGLKECSKCGLVKELGDFRFRKNRNYHRGECKECEYRKYNKKQYEANKQSIVYKATNKINGKAYIGYTTTGLNHRKHIHKHDALKRKKDWLICKAFRKHGWENFEWDVLEETEDPNREAYWIAKLKTLIPNGYNTTPDGKGCSLYRILYYIETPIKEESGFYLWSLTKFAKARGLDPGSLCKVANRERRHHKGYTVIRLG